MRHLSSACAPSLVAGAAHRHPRWPPSPAAAPRRPTPSRHTGADWLDRQLTDGLVHNDQFDFDDYGLTIDVAFGLDGDRRPARGRSSQIRNGAVADNVELHTGTTSATRRVTPARPPRRWSSPRSPTADPTAFGGVDLSAARGPGHQRRPDRRPDRGRQHVRRLRQHDRPGLRRAGLGRRRLAEGRRGDRVPARPAVLRGLLPARLRTRRDAPDQTCDGGSPRHERARHRRHRPRRAPAVGDQGRSPGVVRAAIDDADRRWLAAPAEAPTAASAAGRTRGARTANSTGLAALGARAPPARCRRGAPRRGRWVRELQVTGGVGGTPLAGETGADRLRPDRRYRGRRKRGRHHRRRARPVAPRHRPGRSRPDRDLAVQGSCR